MDDRKRYMYKSMRTLSFRIWMGLLISGFSPSWHEERDTILKAYTNHTMLTLPNVLCILWCLRSQFISAGRDPKNMIWSDQNRKTQTVPSPVDLNSRCFQNPQILRTSLPGVTSSPLSIQSNSIPVLFPVLGFIMTDDDCHILSAWLYHLTIHYETLSSSKPYQTN